MVIVIAVLEENALVYRNDSPNSVGVIGRDVSYLLLSGSGKLFVLVLQLFFFFFFLEIIKENKKDPSCELIFSKSLAYQTNHLKGLRGLLSRAVLSGSCPSCVASCYILICLLVFWF